MRKLVAMLLVLFMMCGVVPVVAEDAYQTLHLPHFSVKVSAEWKLTYNADTMTYAGTAGSDTVEIAEVNLQAVVEGAADDDDDAQRALVDWASEEAMARGAKDAGASASGSGDGVFEAEVRWEADGVGHSLAYYVINGDAISISLSSPGKTESQMEQMALDLFQSFSAEELLVYLPDENRAVPAQSVAALGTGETVYNGLHSFTLPAGLAVDGEPGVLTKAMGEEYTLFFISQTVPEETIRTLTDNPIQFNNFALMFSLVYDIELLQLFSIELADIGMLNGLDAAYTSIELASTNLAMCSQHYRGQSFLVYAISETTPAEVLLNTVQEVARSVVFDGISEEDMLADAEAAANQKYVVITGDSAKVRTEASISGGLIKTVYKGESFPCYGESGDFYIIEIDGRTGYVHKGVTAIQ